MISCHYTNWKITKGKYCIYFPPETTIWPWKQSGHGITWKIGNTKSHTITSISPRIQDLLSFCVVVSTNVCFVKDSRDILTCIGSSIFLMEFMTFSVEPKEFQSVFPEGSSQECKFSGMHIRPASKS